MIHALDIIKITDRIAIGSSNIKMTLLSNTYLIVSPFYIDDKLIPVKISCKKSDMEEIEFQKKSHKNYFSGLPEVEVQKDILIKNSRIITKFLPSMVNLNWTPHRVFVAKQNLQTLNRIQLSAEILEEFRAVFDDYEKMLITNAEGFNQRLDILDRFYHK